MFLPLKILAGLGALTSLATASKSAKAANEVCACLEAPDCGAICPYGGKPKGGGSQACECYEPQGQDLKEVCYSANYNDLLTKPNRALAETDGGPAVNALKLNGYTIRASHNTAATQVLTFSQSGKFFDYVLATELNLSAMACSATTYQASANGKTFKASRDGYGRLTGISLG